MISIVIPTLNEAHGLQSLLPSLAREDELAEVIVVDGGSTDGCAEIAMCLGAQVLRAPRGRGTQLHAGVEASRGEVLFFLHADTVFPPGGLRAINHQLEQQASASGGR